eukprot:gene29356-36551_t
MHVDTVSPLRDIFVVDDISAWVVGDNDTILESRDGGLTWALRQILPPTLSSVPSTSKTSNTTNSSVPDVLSHSSRQWFGVSFANKSCGWIVGSNASVLHTVNGGFNWTLQVTGLPTSRALHAVHAVSPEIVFMVGEVSTIIKSADGGATWELLNVPEVEDGTSGDLYTVGFVGPDLGWAAGVTNLPGKGFLTHDGGTTWQVNYPEAMTWTHTSK